jgi:death-on-curing protein
MKEPVWLTKQQILALHANQIQEHGGSHGVRDDSLLESALGKPQNLYCYAEPTIFEIAASYGYGIIKNHPFVDGNKRTGIVATGVFLMINGWNIEVPEPELVLTTVSVADGSLEEKAFSLWLKENSKEFSHFSKIADIETIGSVDNSLDRDRTH